MQNLCAKIFVILGLLVATALAERKINLEDIERDNLRAEGKPSLADDTRSEETPYSAAAAADKPASQSEYPEPRQYQSEERSSSYSSAPQQQHEKYSAEDYEQDSKYLDNEVAYQKSTQPLQQYAEYHHQQQVQETEVTPKAGLVSHHGGAYEPPQQLFYQQEVIVGNQYQTVQQKAATEKYGKSPNKETLYVNIPMTQLLSYYPNLSSSRASLAKSQVQPLLHRLASEAARQIAVPVYTPSYSREPIYAPSKVAYKIQPQYLSHAPKYQQHTEAILPTKGPSKLIYAPAAPSHPTRQHQQPAAQPHRYLQEIIYTQPGALYAQEVSSSSSSSPSHADVYARPSVVYLRGNAPRHEQQQFSAYTQPEASYYALHAANFAPQLTNQIYQQQPQHGDENAQHQSYETIPETPLGGLDLPRLPATNFKNAESEDSHYTQNHLGHSSEPQSLLDSYVPSRLIAAHDSERYRERPIRLERGFLPSKINFVPSYKKRKAE